VYSGLYPTPGPLESLIQGGVFFGRNNTSAARHIRCIMRQDPQYSLDLQGSCIGRDCCALLRRYTKHFVRPTGPAYSTVNPVSTIHVVKCKSTVVSGYTLFISICMSAGDVIQRSGAAKGLVGFAAPVETLSALVMAPFCNIERGFGAPFKHQVIYDLLPTPAYHPSTCYNLANILCKCSRATSSHHSY
jgi:hypothetical protein